MFNFCHLSFDIVFGIVLPKELVTLFFLFLTKQEVHKPSAEFQTGIIYGQKVIGDGIFPRNYKWNIFIPKDSQL